MNILTIQDLKYTISTIKDINIIYTDGHTLLTRFTEYGDIDCIRLLLENNADPNIPNEDGDYPIHISFMAYNNLEIFQLLVDSGARTDVSTRCGRTILFTACNNKDMFNLALNYNNDIKASDYLGNTLLHCSVQNPEVLNLVLNLYSDINVLNNNKYTPLHSSICCDNESAKILLEAGADRNIQDNNGNTPLHSAVSYGTDETALLLLNLPNVDINTQNRDGETPLHLAIRKSWNLWNLWDSENSMKEIVIKLLDMGAKQDVVNIEGDTLRDLVIESGNTEIMSIFDNYPCVVSLRTLCLRSIRNGNIDTREFPPLLFLQPDESKENKEYLERLQKFTNN